MNDSHAIQTSARIGVFCARHFLALLVNVATVCVVWTVTYFALLVWAALAGGGIGGPLTYPVGLLLFFLATTAAGLLFLFPSTAFAEWIAQRCRLPILAQIPVSVACLGLLCLLGMCLVAALGSSPTFHGLLAGFGVLFLALLVPLGLYWWVAQSGPLLLSLLRRFTRLFRSASPSLS